MLDKLDALEACFDELEARLAAPGLYDDPNVAAALLRERNRLEPVVSAIRARAQAMRQAEEARELLADPELRTVAQEELDAAQAALSELDEKLKILLLPRDPNDDKNIIVEIRAGAGGEESALFARSLYRMYTMYADKRGWNTDLISMNATELGGCKEVIFQILGEGAYSRLKFESGVHRVQRVPETESQGRVHTSTATVAVLPEAEEVDFKIDPTELKIDTFRSSGAGGQHINKTSSAVRLTHIPTGIVTSCQTQRSQFQNRDYAMKMLKAKLIELAETE